MSKRRYSRAALDSVQRALLILNAHYDAPNVSQRELIALTQLRLAIHTLLDQSGLRQPSTTLMEYILSMRRMCIVDDLDIIDEAAHLHGEYALQKIYDQMQAAKRG